MKKKIKNYSFVYLFYDIEEKRVNKVFKICKKYLNHIQNSVFKGDITPSKLIQLEEELKRIIKDNDKITILKFINKNNFDETCLNQKNDVINNENFI